MTPTRTDITNTWDQMRAALRANLLAAWIELDTHLGTRSSFTTGWRVRQLSKMNQRHDSGLHVSSYEVNLDPDAPRHWSDLHVGKCFREDEFPGENWRERRKACLAYARQWASERFGVDAWKRNRSGDYVDACVNRQFPLRKDKRT